MSNQSQSHQSDDDEEVTSVAPQRTIGEHHLDDALIDYRSRYNAGHDASIHAIEIAVCEVVDELKADDVGPVAVVLAIKRQLLMHPASASIHAAVVRRSIERYYE